MKTAKLIVAALALVAACSGSSESGPGTKALDQSLSIPGLTPEPCGTWDGDAVQLLVADALAGCSAMPDGTFHDDYYGNDFYLRKIKLLMDQTTTFPHSFDKWATLRADASKNCDPVTGAVSSVGVVIEKTPIEEDIPFSTPFQTYQRARAHLRQAGVNLCIAQRLRSRSPGASAGEDLLLPEGDQRTLVQTIRERSQIAMLQYALLGSIFATPPQTLANPTLEQTVPMLQAWAAANTPQLEAMGRDFATAVQLHSVVSEEFVQLLARNKSARSPYGGASTSRAEETWGSGSWHQRLLAAAYGGDALYPLDHRTPWRHWDAGNDLSGDVGVQKDSTWPNALQSPYVEGQTGEAQVQHLLRLARQYDRLDLVKDTSASSCELYDTKATGQALYKTLEADVRVTDCYRLNPSDPCPTAPTLPGYDYGQGPYLMFDKYRITPAHAETLATVMIQSLGGRKATVACGSDSFDDALFGPQNFSGTLADNTAGTASHLSAPSTFTNVSPWGVAPTYTRFASARFAMPWEIDGQGYWDQADYSLGLDEINCGAIGCVPSIQLQTSEAKRRMGALAAQAATRDLVVETLAYLGAGLGQAAVGASYFAEAQTILGVLEGSMGENSVSVRTDVKKDPLADGGALVPDGLDVRVKTIVPADDSWWEWTCDTAGCSAYTLVVALKHPRARSLVENPNSSVNGTTALSLAADAVSQGRWAFGQSYVPAAPAGLNIEMPRIWYAVPQLESGEQSYTLAAVRIDTAAPPEEVYSYRLLGANLRYSADVLMYDRYPLHGQYYGAGGALSHFVSRQLAVQNENPSEPAFDGFGLPMNWVPPTNAELIGGAPEETSSAVYLKLAKQSAVTAQEAVESALQDLAQRQGDEVALGIAASKAAAGIQEERDRLCGANNPNCDTSLSEVTVAHSLADCDPSGLVGSDLVKCLLKEFAFDLAEDVRSGALRVSTPVANSVTEPTVPSFKDYEGGSLQQSFIEQWQTLTVISRTFDVLGKAVKAAESTIDLAAAASYQASQEQVAKCSSKAFGQALLAGRPVNFRGGGTNWNPKVEWDGDDDDFHMSLAPFHAQAQACQSATLAQPVAHKAVLKAHAEAFLQIGSAAVAVTEAVAAARIAASKGAALVAEAKLAEKRHELEVSLTKQGLQTSFSVYRVARGYDLWRAKALVENSRRYSLAARRSMEARYVVDLSRMDADEAFVASPKTWADEVYGYDLTLPAAVGLTLSGGSGGESIYPNKLADYVTNLEAFTNGYTASRPAAVAHNDIDVVTLPGTQPGEPVEIPLDPTDPNSATLTGYPQQGRWLVRCQVGNAEPVWTPLGGAGCDGSVDRAKLLFSLDPWGRLNGSITNEPFEKRFNARWGLLAVNFVGTGIRDCEKALDPKACYSEPFIRYNLFHRGSPWVTDYSGVWRSLRFSPGRIEGAKAIAAELWLDPLKDGWSTSYISAVARSEWRHRPLGGAYELEFKVTPDIRLDRIERLQLLIGSSSWVKQD